MPAMPSKTLTLGELKAKIEWMRDLPDCTPITFGGGALTFNRAQPAGYRPGTNTPSIVDIEFNEALNIAPPTHQP